MKIKTMVLVTVLMVLFTGTTVYAENTPTSLVIEIENTVTGDRPSEIETFNFQIKSDNSPLPTEIELEMQGTATESFEEIVYTAPGVYEYSICQLVGDDENYTYCDTVYDLTVYIVTDDNGVLGIAMVTAENHETCKKVSDILFENLYDDPSSESTPQTGDSNNNILWITLAFISLVGIVNFRQFSKKVD